MRQLGFPCWIASRNCCQFKYSGQSLGLLSQNIVLKLAKCQTQVHIFKWCLKFIKKSFRGDKLGVVFSIGA